MSTKSIRNKVKMRGFMCRHSPIMCMSDDLKSVIVPGKSNYGGSSSSMLSVHHHHHCHGRIRVANNNNNNNNNYNNNNHLIKYSKLVNDDKEMEVLLPFGERDDDAGEDDRRLSVSQQKQKQKQKKHQVLEITSRAASTHIFQVVVLRVSLHCQGCAGKVRRHLSRMQGVTSFSIDLETKRVTVMGNVSPSTVLESISKIKRAEFWNC